MGVNRECSAKSLTTLEKIMRKLDGKFSPGLNLSNLSYIQRLQNYFLGVLHSETPFKNLLSLVKLSLMLSLSWLLTPICLFLRRANFRFVDIDLSQIGSIMFLDLFLRENALSQKSPKNRILVLGSQYFEGNKYINDLYREHVTFVRNPFLKLLLSPFFVSPVFANDSSHRYETIHSKVGVAHHIWNNYSELNRKPLISMPHRDVKKAKSALAKYVDLRRPFIALHVRESGFYNIASQNTRNADIQTYKSAIHFLLEQGFNVIRIGDSSMQSISEMQEELGGALFDYAKSEINSPLVDCFLLSHCSFFIGCSSGPASIPFLFHRNSVNVNWHVAINGPNFMLGDITTIKRHYYSGTKKIVPLNLLFEAPFRWGPTRRELEKLGVYLEDNTDEEILGTVKEFLLNNEVSDLQLQAKKLIPNDGYAFGAKGNYSKTMLEQYFPQRF